MSKEKRGTAVAVTPQSDTVYTSAKVDNSNEKSKDLVRLLAYFAIQPSTTLDAMLGTGILRNSITWYVDYAEHAGFIKTVFKGKDKHTNRVAKYYSSNPKDWKNKTVKEPNLFDNINTEGASWD